jgi:hypothetical protein
MRLLVINIASGADINNHLGVVLISFNVNPPTLDFI